MNEQLIKFIELCLMDGVVTDKEREVIFRKSKELGVPEDECEIILEGLIQQHLNNNSISESSNKMITDNRDKDENNKTLRILFKKSISKPLEIDTLNSLTDFRKEKEEELKKTVRDYEKLFERDKEIYPVQESLRKEKQELEDENIAISNKIGEFYEKKSSLRQKEIELKTLKEKILKFQNEEPLFKEVAEIIFKKQNASSSFLQRNLKIGYNRAGRLIDHLEMAGIIGPFTGSDPREIIPKTQKALNELINQYYEYKYC
jgi:hypothetical protein